MKDQQDDAIDWGVTPQGEDSGYIDWTAPIAATPGQQSLGVGDVIRSGYGGQGGIPEPERNNAFGVDTGLALGSGVMNVVGSLAGGIPTAVGHAMNNPDKEYELADLLIKMGDKVSALTGEGSEWAIGKMSTDAQEDISRKWLTPDKESAFLSPSAVWLKTISSLPSMAVAMVPGGMVARATGSAVKGAVAGGLAEGSLVGGSVAEGISTRIDQMPDEQLKSIPKYEELEAEGLEPDQIRTLLKASLIPGSALKAGAASSLLGAIGMKRILGDITASPVLRDKVKNFAKSFAVEGATEALQGGTEFYIEENAVTGKISPLELAEAMVEEGMIGGLMGGSISAYRMSAENKALQAREEAAAKARLKEEERKERQRVEGERWDRYHSESNPAPTEDMFAGTENAPQAGPPPPFGGPTPPEPEVAPSPADALVPERPQDIAAQLKELVNKDSLRKARVYRLLTSRRTSPTCRTRTKLRRSSRSRIAA